ncbi:hypothetical protein AB0B45_12080 [Nonomuraea sp. NPDC049152]|uniref:hypothetical protein n=1 Tax=Nonomuraea sp. NPDC049152 TaxID=3154350 RepID=UPI0033D52561
MAVLATGMGLAGGPASAGVCGRQISANDGSTVASFCDDAAELRAQATHTSMAVPASSEAAMAAEKLAKKLGLPGMSRTSAVLSVADMGGVAAGAGLPSLPAGLPGEAGLPEVSRLSGSPDLPGLPSLPNPDKLPVLPMVPDMPSLSEPALPDRIGKRDLKTPTNLHAPVDAVAGKVKGLVPEELAKSLRLDDMPKAEDALRVAELDSTLDQG